MKILQIIKKILPYLAFASLLVLLDAHSHKIFANLGWNLLLFIMMIRPLSQVFPRISFLKYGVMLRKELGIISASFLLAHGTGFLLQTQTPLLSVFTDAKFWDFSQALAWGIVGVIVSLPLLFTSNLASMKFLGKRWKMLQRLAYVMFIAGGIHVALINPRDAVSTLAILAVWIILWILASRKIVLWKPKNQ